MVKTQTVYDIQNPSITPLELLRDRFPNCGVYEHTNHLGFVDSYSITFSTGKYEVTQAVTLKMIELVKDVESVFKQIEEQSHYALVRKMMIDCYKSHKETSKKVNGKYIVMDALVDRDDQFLVMHPAKYSEIIRDENKI